jgi:phage shock protein C
MNSRLHRSYDDRILAGVAGGIAETYDLDPALVRIFWALLIIITGGVFLLLYIVMAFVIPVGPAQFAPWTTPPVPPRDMSNPGAPAGPSPAPTDPPLAPPGPDAAPSTTATGPETYGHYYDRHQGRYYRRQRRHDGSGALVFGVFLMLVGAYFLVREFVPALNSNLFWPLLIVFGGVLLIVTAYSRPRGDI